MFLGFLETHVNQFWSAHMSRLLSKLLDCHGPVPCFLAGDEADACVGSASAERADTSSRPTSWCVCTESASSSGLSAKWAPSPPSSSRGASSGQHSLKLEVLEFHADFVHFPDFETDLL